MTDDSRWAGFVRAHRLAQNLNQSQFANLLGVSQQTVSRWESGNQVPEFEMQEKLRVQLRVTALNSITYWRRRISNAAGFEVLIDAGLMILAISKKAAHLFMPAGGSALGLKFSEVVPQHVENSGPDNRPKTLESFREIGFFDGLIRSMRLEMEWHLQSGSCACKTDVWPVMTSDQVILGHFSGTPSPIAADASGFQGIRVTRSAIRLNKDDVS